MTDDFESMWAELLPIGRSASSGGYHRSPFASAERELDAWFTEQALARGLDVETDAFGNTVGWWRPAVVVPDIRVPKTAISGLERQGLPLLTGSHLDSVPDGGAFDGPLGVVSALAALDRLRERGVEPSRPLGIGVFVEEEGSRFGLACLGSRLATGQLAWDDARELTDRDGVRLGDVVEGGTSSLLDGVGGFLELHVEQGRDLIHRDTAVGLATGIWPHGRYRFDFTGTADHAGTTRMEDRRDPMLSYAMTALAANKQARLAGQRATFGRVEVHPNGTNAVPSRVTGWLDARAESEEGLAALVGGIEKLASERAARDGTALALSAESVSGTVAFDDDLTRTANLRDWPVIPTQAGHDAGILSTAGIPSAMMFVRNPTGVSHSPTEFAAMTDCLAGVEALADVLEALL